MINKKILITGGAGFVGQALVKLFNGYNVHVVDNLKSGSHRLNNLKKTEKAFYINIFKHFINSNGTIIDQYFLIDKLHLSQEGYNIWKNEIYSVIKKI